MKNIKYFITLFLTVLFMVSISIKAERYIGSTSSGTQWWGSLVSKGNQYILHLPNNVLEWRVNVNGAGDGLTYAQTRDAIAAAYNSWASVSTGNLTFSYNGATTNNTWGNDGQNIHFWAEEGDPAFNTGNPLVSHPSAITVLTFNSSQEIIDVDILYNGKKTWYVGNYWTDVQAIALHEIGHSFGLHHTNMDYLTPKPVMSASPGKSNRSLQFDDNEGISFLYGGKIIDNETFSGTDYYNWDLNVISGKTLTISSGSNIQFRNSAKLTVNGILNVNGTSSNKVTFDFINKSSSPSNGIFVYTGGTADIEHAEIKNSYYGVYSNRGNVVINYSDIHDCQYGAYLYSTDYAGSDPVVTNNYIEDNSSYGIFMYRSDPLIQNNKILNNGSGLRALVYCDANVIQNTISGNSGDGIYGYYYSSFSFYNPTGKNLINNNSAKGIFLYYNSDSFSGIPQDEGKNSIYGNTSYEVYAKSSSNANLMTNYWGATSPPSGEFYADGSSSYNNFLWYSSDQGAGSTLAKSSKEIDELSYAYHYMHLKEYSKAEEIFVKVIENNFEENKSLYALAGLSKCYEYTDRNFIEYLEKNIKNKITDKRDLRNKTYLELKAYWLEEEGKYELAIENYQKLQKEFSTDDEICKSAKLQEGLVYLERLGNKAKAENIFNDIASKNTDEDIAQFMVTVLKEFDKNNLSNGDDIKMIDGKDGLSKTKDAKIVNEYKLLGNYPNPFNPSTTISYSLPSASNVKLEVYDVMGRMIKAFKVNSQSSGRHKVVWDGTNNNGSRVATGIYVYRFEATSIETNEHFVKSEKLMLVK